MMWGGGGHGQYINFAIRLTSQMQQHIINYNAMIKLFYKYGNNA